MNPRPPLPPPPPPRARSRPPARPPARVPPCSPPDPAPRRRSDPVWKVYGEDDCNFNVLAGHKNVVLDLCWNRDGSKVISASADKSVGVWDVNVGRRTRTLSKHSGVVNSVGLGEGSLIVSGSDDCTAKVWDVRSRRVEQEFEAKYQITAACFSHDNELIFTAGIDNEIKAWDRRNESVVFVLEGHKDTITGMAVSPNGASLLTNSMDKSLVSVRACSPRAAGSNAGAEGQPTPFSALPPAALPPPPPPPRSPCAHAHARAHPLPAAPNIRSSGTCGRS